MLQNLEPHQKVRNLSDIITTLLKQSWEWPRVDLSLLNVACLYSINVYTSNYAGVKKKH